MFKSIFELSSKILFGLLYASLILSACSKDQFNNNINQAYISVVNASPENNKILFFVNDTSKTSNGLIYGEKTAYVNTSAGIHQVVTKILTTEVNNARVNLFFEPKKYYSIFIGGKISKDSMVYIATEDNLTAPKTNKAKVRFINTSVDSPTLDAIFSTKATDSLANISNLIYRSCTAYSEYAPGTYLLKIRNQSKKTTLLTTNNLTIANGKIYTIWVKGLGNGQGNYIFSVGLLNDN